jgi:hypothetical protein
MKKLLSMFFVTLILLGFGLGARRLYHEGNGQHFFTVAEATMKEQFVAHSRDSRVKSPDLRFDGGQVVLTADVAEPDKISGRLEVRGNLNFGAIRKGFYLSQTSTSVSHMDAKGDQNEETKSLANAVEDGLRAIKLTDVDASPDAWSWFNEAKVRGHEAAVSYSFSQSVASTEAVALICVCLLIYIGLWFVAPEMMWWLSLIWLISR